MTKANNKLTQKSLPLEHCLLFGNTTYTLGRLCAVGALPTFWEHGLSLLSIAQTMGTWSVLQGHLYSRGALCILGALLWDNCLTFVSFASHTVVLILGCTWATLGYLLATDLRVRRCAWYLSLKSSRWCNYEAGVKNGPKAEDLLVLTIPHAMTGMLVIKQEEELSCAFGRDVPCKSHTRRDALAESQRKMGNCLPS